MLLAERFAQVIATEPSQAQLAAAAAHPRVTYRQATAEEPILDAGTADLAIAAQAAHWFDWPRYIAEVARVTREGALVALVSYGFMHVAGDADELIARYYHDDVGPFWPQGRLHVENGYRDLAWPWPELEPPGASPGSAGARSEANAERRSIDMTAQWSRDELLGYISTWSATVKRIDQLGPDAFVRLGDALARVWPDDERRTVTWPLAIRLARRS